MKTQRRSFVVEIKSKRRSLKTPAKSIWGDADLKALAQAVDDNAPHLFSSNDTSSRPDADSAVPPDLLHAKSADERPGEAGVAQATPSPLGETEADTPKRQQADPMAVDAAEPALSDRPETQSQTVPVAARTRAERKAARATGKAEPRGNKTARSETIGSVSSLDDVATLDAENRRLKKLLAERLRSENLQLKKMLERFAIA
ncbi:MAG: hypothetical protein QM636_05620 [Rhizobium sp.]